MFCKLRVKHWLTSSNFEIKETKSAYYKQYCEPTTKQVFCNNCIFWQCNAILAAIAF